MMKGECKMREWTDYNAEKFKKLNDAYLPDWGEGENMATQAITAINKLVYKWYNDGDVYDNTFCMSGWCNDLSSYANWLYANLNIKRLTDISMVTNGGDYEDILWDVANIVFDEQLLSELEQRECEGSIYDCDGIFQFIDWEEEDEEDW